MQDHIAIPDFRSRIAIQLRELPNGHDLSTSEKATARDARAKPLHMPGLSSRSYRDFKHHDARRLVAHPLAADDRVQYQPGKTMFSTG